jgi:hypothetical protein
MENSTNSRLQTTVLLENLTVKKPPSPFKGYEGSFVRSKDL